MSADANRSFTVAAGYRLHLRRINSPTPGNPTLVFLHEGLGTIGIWGDFPDALCRATGCPGLIYERPGYGASDPRPPSWPDDVLEQEAEIVLPALLDALGIERPVLVGHSDGATIALLFAAASMSRPLGLTQGALAEAMGVPRKHVNQLCNHRRAVAAPTALILARVFGNSPKCWLNVQRRTNLWEALPHGGNPHLCPAWTVPPDDPACSSLRFSAADQPARSVRRRGLQDHRDHRAARFSMTGSSKATSTTTRCRTA